MGLTQGEKAAIERARRGGSAELAVDLDDSICAYLLSVVADDLGLHVEGLPPSPGEFFQTNPEALRLEGVDFKTSLERLTDLDRDSVTFFACLATLHKARLKYSRILAHQPLPTMDQVGPRGLLQFGTMSPKALGALLTWRKWIFDVDNRAAQETGYVFEPIIAHSIGGIPASGRNSPVKRRGDSSKARQVDCIVDRRAYEFKLRVTIAASGQGRWGEELSFPQDCKASGYTPVLVVFDPTANEKLVALCDAFRAAGGETYVGTEAWNHLEREAGQTMARFLDKYVRDPLVALLAEVEVHLPPLTLTLLDGEMIVQVGSESMTWTRSAPYDSAEADPLPDDVSDELTGP